MNIYFQILNSLLHNMSAWILYACGTVGLILSLMRHYGRIHRQNDLNAQVIVKNVLYFTIIFWLGVSLWMYMKTQHTVIVSQKNFQFLVVVIPIFGAIYAMMQYKKRKTFKNDIRK